MAITIEQYSAQIQDPLRQGIVDMLWQSSRIMPLLNFIQHKGFSYPYTKRTKRPGAAVRGIGGTFDIKPGAHAPDIETMAILGGKVKTDTIMETIKPQLRQNEIAGTMESAGLMFDRLFFHGDPTQRPNEFYGLYARISGNQLLTNSANGATPVVGKVTELLDAVAGPNSAKRLFMNRTVRRVFSKAVVDDAGGKGIFDVGKQLTSFENAPIIEVEKDETDAEILQFNETCGNSNVCSSIICARLGGSIDEQDVQGIMGAELQFTPAGNFGEYMLDVVQMLCGIGVFGGFSMARLQGITAA